MRDLKQHPLTKDEMLQALDWAILTRQDKLLFGDITIPALQQVKRLINDI